MGSEFTGLLAEDFADDQQGADESEGDGNESSEGEHCGSFLRVFNIHRVNSATHVTNVTVKDTGAKKEKPRSHGGI